MTVPVTHLRDARWRSILDDLIRAKHLRNEASDLEISAVERILDAETLQVTPVEEPLLDARTVAFRLGISLGTVRDMARTGRIPHLSLASVSGERNRLRFRWSEVVAWRDAAPLSPRHAATAARQTVARNKGAQGD